MRKYQLLATAAVLAIASSAIARADDQPVETQVVDAMNKAFGPQHGFRANHAKGVVVEGSFKASREAAALSRAVLFNGSMIPVTVRFSDSTGVPDPAGRRAAGQSARHGDQVPSAERRRDRHGDQFAEVLPGGQRRAEFRDLLLAVAASPPMPPSRRRSRSSPPATRRCRPPPARRRRRDSFADEEYYGIDAFVFVNKAGGRQAVRYLMVPERWFIWTPRRCGKAGAGLPDERAAPASGNGKVTFHLEAQLAQPGDPTNDATKPWPADRKIVDLGVLTIDKAVPDSAQAQKALLSCPATSSTASRRPTIR